MPASLFRRRLTGARPARRLVRLALLALAVLALSSPGSASAGQWRATYDFAGDLGGWTGQADAPYLVCGRTSPAGCPDLVTNRLHARPGSAAPAWAQARWDWAAPAGATIVSGRLAYRTRMRHAAYFARVKVRNEPTSWADARVLVNEVHDTNLTDHAVDLPGGYRQLGIALYNHPEVAASAVTSAWDDYVSLTQLDVVMEEFERPGLAWVAGPGDGWTQGIVCQRVRATDGVSGVYSATMTIAGRATWWVAQPTTVYRPGAPAAEPTLCLDGLPEGIHQGGIGAVDIAGNASDGLAFVARIDRTPPTGGLELTRSTSARRPLIGLVGSDATSGIVDAQLTVDSRSLALRWNGRRWEAEPSWDLAIGAHEVRWSLTDRAGLRASGSDRFDVVDATPPAIGSLRPGRDAVYEGLRPAIGFSASDAETGVDPATFALEVDGAAVAGAAVEAGGLVYQPQVDLAIGGHRVVARVADRAGNRSAVTWQFSVVAPPAPAPAPSPPVTPPVVGNPGTPPPPAGPALPPAGGTPQPKPVLKRLHIHAVRATIGPRRARRVPVAFRVLRAGMAARGVRAEVTVRSAGRERLLFRRSDRTGLVRVVLDLPAAARVVARVKGAAATVRIAAPRVGVALAASPKRPRAGERVVLRGVARGAARRTVTIEALSVRGWARAAATRAGNDGRFQAIVLVPSRGRYLIRARVVGVAGAVSSPLLLVAR